MEENVDCPLIGFVELAKEMFVGGAVVEGVRGAGPLEADLVALVAVDDEGEEAAVALIEPDLVGVGGAVPT